MSTLTTADVLRHAADNLEAGRHALFGLEGRNKLYTQKWESAADWHDSTLLKLHHEFRLAPKTITYTVTHPEPLREAPTDGAKVWAMLSDGLVGGAFCGSDVWYRRCLERGNLFATKEDAQAADAARLAAYRSAT